MNWLGLGSLALGAWGAYNTYEQGKKADEAVQKSNQLSQEQLDLAKVDRDRYNRIYGSLEENLAKYYTNLTPKQRTTMGLDRYDQDFQQALKSYNQQMAQRGLTGSGVDAEGLNRMYIQSAKDRANIANQSERETYQDKLGFLGVGLGQSNIATQNVNNAYRSMENSYNNQANIYQQYSNQSAAGLGQLMQGTAYAYSRDKDIFSGNLNFWSN